MVGCIRLQAMSSLARLRSTEDVPYLAGRILVAPTLRYLQHQDMLERWAPGAFPRWQVRRPDMAFIAMQCPPVIDRFLIG